MSAIAFPAALRQGCNVYSLRGIKPYRTPLGARCRLTSKEAEIL